MTRIQISLPDEVAQRARHAGLLSDSAIQQLLEEAMRRRAGRALIEVARGLQDAAIPAMSMEEIDAEVKAARAERRARAAAGGQASAIPESQTQGSTTQANTPADDAGGS
jgi:hypothetical protein